MICVRVGLAYHATNNANVIGFPDYLYQTSSDFAMFVDYVLDESWALDSELDVCMSTDNSKDPYFVNGLAASSNEELAEIDTIHTSLLT